MLPKLVPANKIKNDIIQTSNTLMIEPMEKLKNVNVPPVEREQPAAAVVAVGIEAALAAVVGTVAELVAESVHFVVAVAVVVGTVVVLVAEPVHFAVVAVATAAAVGTVVVPVAGPVHFVVVAAAVTIAVVVVVGTAVVLVAGPVHFVAAPTHEENHMN